MNKTIDRYIDNVSHFCYKIANIFAVAKKLYTPSIDFLARLILFNSFFISGVLKLGDWDNALYLAENEYAVSWASAHTIAIIDIIIELVAAPLLLIGLFTRFAAFSMLLLSLFLQITYYPTNSQVFWIILLSWFVVKGAGRRSLDSFLDKGLDDSIFSFVSFFKKIFRKISYFEHVYLVLVRCWLSLTLLSFIDAGMIPFYKEGFFLFLQNDYSFIDGITFSILLFLSVCIFLGFNFRLSLIALLSYSNHLSLYNGTVEFVFWFVFFIFFILNGAGKYSLDSIIKKYLKLFAKNSKNYNNFPHIVIVGAGFAGVTAAKLLKNTACKITLIDKHNYHLFQPLLYQVATASLAPSDIAQPIRSLFDEQSNIRILMNEVVKIDSKKNQVFLKDNNDINYDYLILATGATHSYFGKNEWQKYAPGLKTLEDAIEIRQKILQSFEKAENFDDKQKQQEFLSFVIIGGGPTGVELAGSIAELAYHGMKGEFSHLDPNIAKIYLIQSPEYLLPNFDNKLSDFTQKSLEKLGVIVLTNNRVTNIDDEGVSIGDQKILSQNVFWAAGVQASPIKDWLEVETDRSNRVVTDEYLRAKNYENIFIAGDAALSSSWKGNAMPGIAPAAKQSGKYIAQYIRREIEERKQIKAFKYIHYGNLATIGRKSAVADFSLIKIKGSVAWWLWGIIHIFFLVGAKSRITVMLEWFWAYVTFKKGTRLITKS